MPFDKFDWETIGDERRKSIAQTLRVISTEELTKIGNEIFRYADDPWRETFFKFLKDHAGATVHHAVTSDGANVLYSADSDQGMWYVPGSGMGPLQKNGKETMKKIIEGHH